MTNTLLNEILYDAFLFEDSIYNNIRFARPDASPDEVIAATDMAGVLDFAWNLPEGLHTRIGERGVVLSHTQRMRVSLARVFLRHAACTHMAALPAITIPGSEYPVAAAGEVTIIVLGENTLVVQNGYGLAVLI